MDRFSSVEVRTSCGGLGVFALEPIVRGRLVLEFSGPRVDRATILPIAAGGGHDGFLQVGADSFIGLSGGADDFVNHSCLPNAYVRIEAARVVLVALRDIAAGEELNFDYALTQQDFPFRFQCHCGAAGCRGEIGDFDEIPPATLDRYRALGAIPQGLQGRKARRQRLTKAL